MNNDGSRTTLTRRRWLANAAVTGAAALAGVRPAARAAEKFALRYITASSMYGNLPLAEVLAEVRKAGADSVDLWPKPHGTQREEAGALGDDALDALLEKHRVKLGMLTRYDFGALGIQKEIPFAKRHGAKVLITGVGAPAGLAGDELKKAVADFVEKLKPAVEAAAEAGLVLGIENHAKSLIESPDSMRRLAELSPSDRLGVALAPYHLPQDPALLAALIRDLGPRLVHFYAWQHGAGAMQKLPKEEEMLQMPGRGTLDFSPLLRALKDIGYRGWTSVFMHPFPRGFPILPTAAETTAAINESRRHLDGLAAAL